MMYFILFVLSPIFALACNTLFAQEELILVEKDSRGQQITYDYLEKRSLLDNDKSFLRVLNEIRQGEVKSDAEFIGEFFKNFKEKEKKETLWMVFDWDRIPSNIDSRSELKAEIKSRHPEWPGAIAESLGEIPRLSFTDRQRSRSYTVRAFGSLLAYQELKKTFVEAPTEALGEIALNWAGLTPWVWQGVNIDEAGIELEKLTSLVYSEKSNHIPLEESVWRRRQEQGSAKSPDIEGLILSSISWSRYEQERSEINDHLTGPASIESSVGYLVRRRSNYLCLEPIHGGYYDDQLTLFSGELIEAFRRSVGDEKKVAETALGSFEAFLNTYQNQREAYRFELSSSQGQDEVLLYEGPAQVSNLTCLSPEIDFDDLQSKVSTTQQLGWTDDLSGGGSHVLFYELSIDAENAKDKSVALAGLFSRHKIGYYRECSNPSEMLFSFTGRQSENFLGVTRMQDRQGHMQKRFLLELQQTDNPKEFQFRRRMIGRNHTLEARFRF